MWAMTISAVDLAKDSPLAILDRALPYNWTAILQPVHFYNALGYKYIMRKSFDIGYEDMHLWSRLYWLAYLVYQEGKEASWLTGQSTRRTVRNNASSTRASDKDSGYFGE